MADETLPSDEPQPWLPPAPCPRCGETQTRFVEMRYEISVYACEICEIQFEIEE